MPFAIGGALFLVSDLILAAGLFNDTEFRFSGDVIWFTYGVGQMLIVMTAGAGRRGLPVTLGWPTVGPRASTPRDAQQTE